MAQKPPEGPKAQAITDEALRVRVDIDLSDFYNRLETEATRLLIDFQQQGYKGHDLADRVAAGLQQMSDAPIERMARGATTEAFNLGRNLEAQVRISEVGEVVRTEILDENTCPPCESLDGKVYQMNTPEYFENMPPNHCDGRDLCRGFYLYRKAA